jgi:ketosteroid isomerase-like protein
VSANLDLVRSIYADWERGDFSRSEWADPDIEYVVADGPERGRWIGRDAMANAWANLISVAEYVRAQAEECRELDDEQVFVLVRNSGRGKASGMEVGNVWRGANLIRIRDGKVTRLVVYMERDHAFADLGLTPDELDERELEDEAGSLE